MKFNGLTLTQITKLDDSQTNLYLFYLFLWIYFCDIVMVTQNTPIARALNINWKHTWRNGNYSVEFHGVDQNKTNTAANIYLFIFLFIN